MANWASTDYVIEGPRETLEKIENAILHHDVEENSSSNWEGNVLKALDITWQREGEGSLYMRGFIDDTPWWDKENLRFYAEEAWGVSDFSTALEGAFPDIKIYWSVEEPNEAVYATNDVGGKYFNARFYVDACIDGNYDSEYFTYESDVYKWLYKRTNGEVNTKEKVEEFNKKHENSDEDFISIHEFSVIE